MADLYKLRKTFTWAAAGVGTLLIANAVYKALTRVRLENSVVLITGGSRGFGLVLARAFAQRGARLAICGRSADSLELARQELEQSGAKIIALPVDVTNRDEVQTMVRDVIAHYGRIDVLVNNAGMAAVGPQENMRIDDYERAMDIHFWAPLYAIHAILPHFLARGGGRIVNITSIGGVLSVPHLLPYSASKFASVGLSQGMHAELRRKNILVTTVIPGLMRTGSPRNIDVKGDYEKEYAWFKIADSTPMLSQKAEVAAEKVIRAVEQGQPEAILSLSGKLAMIVKGLAPSWITILMAIANRILPDPTPHGNVAVKGYEAESALSRGPISSLSDREASKNNE